LSTGKDFSGGSYNEETFYGAGDILIRGTHIKFVIIPPRADSSWGRHFDVTPTGRQNRQATSDWLSSGRKN